MKNSSPPTAPSALVCIDNRVGYEVLRFLIRQQVQLVGVIVHPAKTALFREEILRACSEVGVPVWDVEEARRDFNTALAGLAPDYLVSIYFDYILDQRFLDLPRKDAINLHPGYLPYNKGFYYYVWALLDGTPAGVSIHRMAADVDAGDILSQKRVLVTPTDTGETLYRKHEDAAIELFQGTWTALVEGQIQAFPQQHPGTHHKAREARALGTLDPAETMTAMQFIDRLRVYTFPGRSGCTISLGGRSYRIHLELQEVGPDGAGLLPGKTV